MSAKKRNYDTRTILIVLFVIVVIIAGYIVVTNLPEEEEFLTPEEVLNNTDLYLNGDKILVKGYYLLDPSGPVVISTLSTTTGRAALELDLTGLDTNITDVLREEVKFKFIGILKIDEDNPLGNAVIFDVEKIEEI
jgi:hypothetical protein